MTMVDTHWFTGTQTIFNIALEDHSVRLSESERFIHTLQCRALRCEPSNIDL